MVNLLCNMLPQISVYGSLALLLSASFLQSVQTGGPVTVHVMKNSSYDGSMLWFHLSIRVSGGGGWLRGRGCLRNDTCASGGTNIYNAVHIGGRQACINGPDCQGFLFNIIVVDSDQILKLDMFRNEAGNVLTINGSCTDDDYRLKVSNGHQYSTYQYNQLGSTSSSTYQCQRERTTTFTTASTSTGPATTAATTSTTVSSSTLATTSNTEEINSPALVTVNGSACTFKNVVQMDHNLLVKVIPAAVIGELVLIAITAVVTTIIVRRQFTYPRPRDTQHAVQPTSDPTYENQSLGTADHENQLSLSTISASSTYMNLKIGGARKQARQASETGVRVNQTGSVYTELSEVLRDDHEYTTPNTGIQ